MSTRRLTLALVSTAAIWGASAGSALAAASPPLGQHVSSCAHASLGQRDNPPSVTCTDNGVTMSFANVGAMVQYMRSDG